MKCSFLLQRQFAYIGQYIAEALQTNGGEHEFSGYVYLRSSYRFLTTQKQVRYSMLLLDQEIHNRWKKEKLDKEYLKDLETRIGLPSLWPYLIADRVLMQEQLVREYPHDRLRYTHEELLRMLQVRAKAIDTMMEQEKPDIVFGIPPGALGSMLFYHIARAHGAKTLFVYPANVQDRYLLTEDYTTFTPIDAIFRDQADVLLASEHGQWAKAYLASFLERPLPNYEKATPTYQPVTRSRQFGFLKPMRAFRALTEITGSIQQHFKTDERHDYDYIHPFWQNVDLIKRKLRNLRGTSDLYDTFDPNEEYAFFPLHFEPELSLLVLAPHFTNQMQLIEQIARSLPVAMKLYVKDHPAMAQFRPRSFYKRLKAIPNVKLISPTFTGFDLTRNAKIVTTITSTAGWEACLFGRPVISFGRQNFNVLTNVTHCPDLEQLPEVIKERLNDTTSYEKDTLAYLAAMHVCSFEMKLMQLWGDERDQEKRRAGMQPLADALMKAAQS